MMTIQYATNFNNVHFSQQCFSCNKNQRDVNGRVVHMGHRNSWQFISLFQIINMLNILYVIMSFCISFYLWSISLAVSFRVEETCNFLILGNRLIVFHITERTFKDSSIVSSSQQQFSIIHHLNSSNLEMLLLLFTVQQCTGLQLCHQRLTNSLWQNFHKVLKYTKI